MTVLTLIHEILGTCIICRIYKKSVWIVDQLEYLEGQGVVTEEALVLEWNQDALLGSEVDLGACCAVLHVEHVLLQPSRRLGEFFEVTAFVGARDDAGRKDERTPALLKRGSCFVRTIRGSSAPIMFCSLSRTTKPRIEDNHRHHT